MTPAGPGIPRNTRLRGGNINPRFVSGGDDVWIDFWYRWEFDSWIRPMVDDVAAAGANCVRIFGNTAVVTSGKLTLDTYLSRWRQVLEYCAARSLYVLPCGGDLSHWGPDTDAASAERHYRAWSQLLANYDRVIGVDVTNEASDQSRVAGAQAYTQSEPWYDLIERLGRLVRSESGKPITHSRSVTSRGQWRSGSPFTDALSDFLSIHCYYPPDPDDPLPLEESAWGRNKNLLLGEFGLTGRVSGTAWQDQFRRIAALEDARTNRVGALAWPLYPLTSSERTSGVLRARVDQRTQVRDLIRSLPDQR